MKLVSERTGPIRCIQVLFGLLILLFIPAGQNTCADDVAGKGDSPRTASADELKAARDVIEPLAKMIREATASRATVEVMTRTQVNGEDLSAERGLYQISSLAPKCYALYFRTTDQSFRISCDGEATFVQIDETAYFPAMTLPTLKDVVTQLPAPAGPYPEPVLALTLCGVDPTSSLLTDMQSVQVSDREPYNGTDAVHLKGTQIDGVVWDLWIATQKGKIQPLRMTVDLSKVIATSDGSPLPDNFRYEVEFLFTLHRMSGDYTKEQFRFEPPQDAEKYESIDDYYQSFDEAVELHPLVGKVAPALKATVFQKQSVKTPAKTIDLDQLKQKVVVLDFWATWCGPCIQAMPIMERVTKKFAGKGVVFFAVNVGEPTEDVETFFLTSPVQPNVLLDPSGSISEAYRANAIPQTVIIGKSGLVEAVHIGYQSLEQLEADLTKQLETLTMGQTLIPGATEETVTPNE